MPLYEIAHAFLERRGWIQFLISIAPILYDITSIEKKMHMF